MPTLQFSRRSQPGIVPDVEVPADVFVTASGRAIGAGASAAATHRVSFDKQAAARGLFETEIESLLTSKLQLVVCLKQR
jgi:hypothetical protein